MNQFVSTARALLARLLSAHPLALLTGFSPLDQTLTRETARRPLRARWLVVALVMGISSLPFTTARAGVIWNFVEDASGVTGTFSGSLNLSGAVSSGRSNVNRFVSPSLAGVGASDLSTLLDLYTITDGPTQFGTGGSTFAEQTTGDRFAVLKFSNQIGVPPGYTSGSPLSGSLFFANRTFSGLGMTKGTYVFSLPNDTVTLNIGVTTLRYAYTGTIQSFTVPATGTYRIEAYGAKGGDDVGFNPGGIGARISGDFALAALQANQILVGGAGGQRTVLGGAGGGGGTFVVAPGNSPIVVAGGGGGASGFAVGGNGDTSVAAGSTSGGAGSGSGSGGGGLTGDGGNGTGQGGRSFLNGGAGGVPPLNGAPGGFGGGGASGNTGGGGGGGYRGGAGSGAAISPGGGGSFSSGTNQSNTVAPNPDGSGNGQVTITGNFAGLVAGQTYTLTYLVNNTADLMAALAAIDVTGTSAGPNLAYTIVFGSDITLTQQLWAINLSPGASLTIEGQGHFLDGANTYNGFFVYNGQVAIKDLTIRNAKAIGGAGGNGSFFAGGGGAGLGGGLFVSATSQVTLSSVSFSNNTASGGAGGVTGQTLNGGGGGLNGGPGANGSSGLQVGGGGVGLGASGGRGGQAGGAGIIYGAASGSSAPAGGAAGGAYGGGGGGSSNGNLASAGGGGVVTNGPTANGGFGGGASEGGNSGFGGGGAVVGTTVGFGGGGANRTGVGFGGGAGGGGGGGGLGAGGHIFVQQGGQLTVTGGTLGAGIVTGGVGGADPALGSPGSPGSAFGDSIFAQGNQSMTLGAPSGQTLAIAGVIADQTGSGGAGGNAGAGAVIIDNNAGTVQLTGANTYTGGTTLNGGTFALSGSGKAGAGAITFVPGKVATLSAPAGTQLTNMVNGFSFGHTIALTGAGTATSATLGANNVLSITGGTVSPVVVNLDPAQSFAGYAFRVAADGNGGTLVTLGIGNVSYAINAGTANLFTITGLAVGSGTFTGPGVTGSSFNPQTVGYGPQTITFTPTTGSAATFTLTVTEAPSLVVTTVSDTTADDGQTTLREAIAYANSGNAGANPTIRFNGDAAVTLSGVSGAVNFYDSAAHTITLGGTELGITGNVTVVGAGGDKLIVSGNDVSRVMHVTGGTVEIRDLTVTHGRGANGIDNPTRGATAGAAPGGAGIANEATLTLTRVDVNFCQGGAGGAGDSILGTGGAGGSGGIHNTGTLTLTGGTIGDNNGGAGGTGSFPGAAAPGGISNTGTLTATGTTIRHNTGGRGANGVDGLTGGVGGPGGVGSTRELTVIDCAVTENVSGAGGTGGGGGNGGHGGGLAVNGTTIIRGTLISGNTNGAGSASNAASGAGIFCQGSLTMTNSTIRSNTTSPRGRGGGLFCSAGASALSLVGCTIANNTAFADGGADFFQCSATMLNCTVSGNTGTNASQSAGVGIFAGTLTMRHCTVVGNTTGILINGNSGQNTFLNIGHTVLANLGSNLVQQTSLGGTATTTSLGYNLSSDAAGGSATTGPGGQLNTTGDQRNTPPLLGSLQNNGGPTETCAPQVGSPAIDAGDPAFDANSFTPALTTDQRGAGHPRVLKGSLSATAARVDIGAVEFGVPLETQIISMPAAVTDQTTAPFAFIGISDQGEVTFEGSLDHAPFTPVTSPAVFTSLANGPHTFEVRAVDPFGTADATPASYSWTVQTSSSTPGDDRFFVGSNATTFDVLANDHGLLSGILTITGVTQPARGSVRVVGGRIVYTPVAPLSGPVTFTYTVSNGSQSMTRTVTLFAPPQPGTYVGLLADSGDELRGRIDVVLNQGGACTGILRTDASRRPFWGSILGQSGLIVYGFRAPRPLTLLPGPDYGTGNPALLASVGAPAAATTLTGLLERSPYDRTHPAPQAGRYTMVANRPDGGSGPETGAVFACTISTAGSTVFTGKLGDAAPLNQGGTLLAGGRFPFYFATGSTTTLRRLVGELTFDRQASPKVSGTLRWSIPARVNPRLPSGVNQDYTVIGAPYTVPVDGSGFLSFTGAPQVVFSLQMSSISSTPKVLTQTLVGPIRAGNAQWVVQGGIPGQLGRMILDLNNGFYGGFYVDRKQRPNFFGVVLQGAGLNYGQGFVLDVGNIGAANLTPVDTRP